MKILFLCHRFPYPPLRGGKIRPFNIIRHLSRRHEVFVASLARSPEEAADGAGIAPHCADFRVRSITPAAAWARMILRLPWPGPSSMGYFYAPALARDLKRWLAQHSFDLVFVHCSSVAPYLAGVTGPRKILDFGDMDSQKWLTYARFKNPLLAPGYWLEGKKLEAAERALAQRFDLCSCTTRAELETLRGYGLATPSDWFPNGVDLEAFQPADEAYDPDQVCFIGRMDYYPNIQAMEGFVSQVLPLIRARRPAAKLAIVGAAPGPGVRALARIEGVTVTGTVPDVRPYVTAAALCVAPLKIARGTQNKILESLAMGVPVVTSSAAAGGVDVVPGEHLLVADAPADTAAAVLSLLADPQRRQALARAGRARMESHHSWAGAMTRLDAIIDRVMGEGVMEPGRADSAA